jgi:hypothetical protein
MHTIEIFRETLMSFKKLHIEDLKRGSISELFNAKSDCDLMQWFTSLPLDPLSGPNATEVVNRVRKTCMEMHPCIKKALSLRMGAPRGANVDESIECLVIRYEELEHSLYDLARVIDPASLKLLQLCLG